MHKLIILTTILSMLSCIHSSLITESLSKDDLRALQKKVLSECEKEHNVGETEMRSFIQTGQVPSEQFKCMLGCYGEKIGMIKDGKIQWDVIHLERKIHHGEDTYKNKMSQVVENCKSTVKDDSNKCELSIKLAKCMQEGFKSACGGGKC
ncbi:hypothetical protein O3M35_000854 [Rhynocoris fuscipes]|uniref:Uncharacterized protein n=1 Tax=Rhynocoris fuscipes TaxID=488301 RepID=A0AAW1DQ85_9HEMI